jgi:tRNA pseudouridine55 synthase
MCIGPSTRLAEYLSDLPKEYVARARLGVRTETDDPEGEAVGTSEDWRELSPDRIASAVGSFLGEAAQVPPPFSAKKVGGERAYRLARRGGEVELPGVPVTIHEIVLLRIDLPFVDFRVLCSTGTYIRALARDLGERLAVGAHLTGLRRVAIGPFAVDGAVSPEGLSDPVAVAGGWLSPLAAVAHLPQVRLPSEEALRTLRNGQALPADDLGATAAQGKDLAVALGERLVAIAVQDGNRIRPKKVFALE